MRQAFNGRHSGMWTRLIYTRSGIRTRTLYGMAWQWLTEYTPPGFYIRMQFFCTATGRGTHDKCTRSENVLTTISPRRR